MQGVGALGQKPLLECGFRQRALKQVRCGVDGDGKSKNIPVRLPGGRMMPAYGSSGEGKFSRSAPGLGQFRPPNLFGTLSSCIKILNDSVSTTGAYELFVDSC